MLDLLITHWPFAAVTLVFFVVGEAMKRGPFSSARAKEVRWVRFVRRWLPLPLHPIAAGLGLGFIPDMPTTLGEATSAEKALYYGAAGALSVIAKNVYKEWREYQGKPVMHSEPPTE